jgi:uncharacterized protein
MRSWWTGVMAGVCLLAGMALGVWANTSFPTWRLFKSDLLSPFVADQSEAKKLPFLAYTIPALASRSFTATGPIVLTQTTKTDPAFSSVTFKFTTMGKTMSGLLNIPTGPASTSGWPTLIMVRGFVAPEDYQPGVGTKNAAEFFAQHGYVTIAPDFFGYGQSEADFSDSWESRFTKPIQLAELIKTVEMYPTLTASPGAELKLSANSPKLNPAKLGIWAHSNGGQITLTTLEALHKPIPATFWAPVTAPFPYSLLYFSDENDDEGKLTRNWIAQFERDYDAFDFSLTQHLDLLHGTYQLHHGTADDSALKAWSDEFLAKVKKTNTNRPKDDQIIFHYFTYPGANHNLQPGWDAAIQRDLEYFAKAL